MFTFIGFIPSLKWFISYIQLGLSQHWIEFVVMTGYKGVELKLLLPRLTYDGGDDGHGRASRKLSWLFHRSLKARLLKERREKIVWEIIASSLQ